MSARNKAARPVFLRTKPDYLVQIPWVQTSGAKGSKHEWNNGAHAALHSILAGLKCTEKQDVAHWLGVAQEQINDAVRCLARKSAEAMPLIDTKKQRRAA